MNDELFLRISASVLAVVTFGIIVYYHRRVAHLNSGISRRDEEGLFFTLLLRISGLVTWGSVVLFIIQPELIWWSKLFLPIWVRWVGVIFCVVFIFLLYWVFESLGKNLTYTIAVREDHVLITHGLYHWVRHPMYVASFLGLLASSVVTDSWLVALGGFFSVGLLISRVPREEKNLLKKFGEKYKEYCKNTGRFFPW